MDYKGVNDRVLWERCQNGDEVAYGEIFRRHSPQMLRITRRYVKDPMVAEELVMDCFFNLWTKRGSITDANFLNYLFQSVRNSIISNYRKEIRIVIELEQVENKLSSDRASDHDLISEDIRGLYDMALRKLTPRRRQAFLMSRAENLDYSEIARRMAISESAVDNYISAALDGLRANMKECLPILALILFLRLF